MAFCLNKINKKITMKNKLIIIVLFSIIQIFSTSSIKKKSNDFVFSDSIATASSAGNTDMLNKSNGIADFVA
jgi:hypothetical protein